MSRPVGFTGTVAYLKITHIMIYSRWGPPPKVGHFHCFIFMSEDRYRPLDWEEFAVIRTNSQLVPERSRVELVVLATWPVYILLQDSKNWVSDRYFP